MRRMFDIPISGEWEPWEPDEEMGFLPALAAALPAIGAIAPVVGGLFGGGDKAAPAPVQAAASGGGGIDAGTVMALMSGAGNKSAQASAPQISPEALRGIVAEVVRAVPPPVRQQVEDAVRAQLSQQQSAKFDIQKSLQAALNQLGPVLKSQLDKLDNASVQRQATYEHESIKRSDARWKANADAQNMILSRLASMEARLGGAIEDSGVRARRLAAAYGAPKRVTG